MDFDYRFSRHFYNSVIEYGIIKGNNKIVFIKPGLNGSLFGYKDKYLKLGKYINDKYGYSVICSSNPQDDGKNNPLEDMMDIINEYTLKMGYSDYKIYYYGNSNGGVIGAKFAYLYPSVNKVLLINPPLMYNYLKMERSIEKFNGQKLTFIYGSLDPSYKLVGLLGLIKNTRIKYYVIEGEDHNFSKNICSLEELVDKYLLN